MPDEFIVMPQIAEGGWAMSGVLFLKLRSGSVLHVSHGWTSHNSISYGNQILDPKSGQANGDDYVEKRAKGKLPEPLQCFCNSSRLIGIDAEASIGK